MKIQDLKILRDTLRAKLMENGVYSMLPYKINFAITFKCQSRCKTCGIWKKYVETPFTANSELETDEIRYFFERNPVFSWISLTGGEPFLRDDLVTIVDSAFQNCRPAILTIPTNGLEPHRIEKVILEILENNKIPRFIITVSLDGPKEVHDFIRGIKGAWEKSLETFIRLRRIQEGYGNLKVLFEHTVSRFNVGSFKRTVEALYKQSIDVTLNDFILTLAHTSSHYYNNVNMELNPFKESSNINGELNWLINNKTIHSLDGFALSIYLKIVKRYLHKGGVNLSCPAAFGSCFINPYGEVFPCSIFNLKLGSLREKSFSLKDIWFSKKSKTVRKQIKERRCPRCWSPCEAYPAILHSPVNALLSIVEAH